MNKFIITTAIAVASLLAGCNDGRDFTPASVATFQEVTNTLQASETMAGRHHDGMGGALLHELRFHTRSFREGKWYVVGDHYSVSYKAGPDGLTFGVARDH
jgi:hypothetical protein